MTDWEFYKNKKVLITGHTGFKGSWICKVLVELGAKVTGYALCPPTTPSMYELCEIDKCIESVEGDVRDLEHLMDTFKRVQPEIVIHMAAQPIVLEGYKNPVYTYDVNVMGTVNVLECVRNTASVRSFVNVTTDKVYKNREWEWGYRENEELNGYDPYSNSKSCSELVTSSYVNSYFSKDSNRNIAISTVRAGNVIGGGDFAADRIVPDCVRAIENKEMLIIRNPYSVRPYQHVLEPVCAYLMIAARQYVDNNLAGNYNVGPEETDCLETGELVRKFCESYEMTAGISPKWQQGTTPGPHEANFLRLDCQKLKTTFGWKPCLDAGMAVELSAQWYAKHIEGMNVDEITTMQIRGFLKIWQEKNL